MASDQEALASIVQSVVFDVINVHARRGVGEKPMERNLCLANVARDIRFLSRSIECCSPSARERLSTRKIRSVDQRFYDSTIAMLEKDGRYAAANLESVFHVYETIP